MNVLNKELTMNINLNVLYINCCWYIAQLSCECISKKIKNGSLWQKLKLKWQISAE